MSETLEVSNIPRLGVLGGFALTFYTWDLGRTFWCPDILGFPRVGSGIWKWNGFGQPCIFLVFLTREFEWEGPSETGPVLLTSYPHDSHAAKVYEPWI